MHLEPIVQRCLFRASKSTYDLSKCLHGAPVLTYDVHRRCAGQREEGWVPTTRIVGVWGNGIERVGLVVGTFEGAVKHARFLGCQNAPTRCIVGALFKAVEKSTYDISTNDAAQKQWL